MVKKVETQHSVRKTVLVHSTCFKPANRGRGFQKSISLFLDQKELIRQRRFQGSGKTQFGVSRAQCVTRYKQEKHEAPGIQQIKYCRDCNQLRNELQGGCYFCEACKTQVQIALKSVFAANKWCAQNYKNFSEVARLSEAEINELLLANANFPYKRSFVGQPLNEIRQAYLELICYFLRLYQTESGIAELLETVFKKLYVSRKENVRTILKFVITADECDWQKISNIKFVFCKRFNQETNSFELEIDRTGTLQTSEEQRSQEILREVFKMLCLRLRKNWKGMPVIQTEKRV